jgi:hypothetical protein
VRAACRSLVLASTIVASAGDAPANETSIQDLYYKCKSEDAFDLGFCLGFVGGVGQTLDGIGQTADTASNYYSRVEVGTAFLRLGMCGKATIGAYRQAFINWAEQHPEKWNSHMGIGVMTALRETWPCPGE